MVEWNAELRRWGRSTGRRPGGYRADKEKIGPSDLRENIVWQARSRPPTEYENALGDALEEILGDGVHDLAGIVARLNDMGFRAFDGAAWTEEKFEEEIKHLGT